MEDPVVGKFIQVVLFEEILPTLDLPLQELQDFAAAVLERFSNPFIRHLLMSISLNSWAKFETRVLPSLLEYKKRKGVLPSKLCFSLAATITFYRGKRGEEDIALNDDAHLISLLKEAWAKYDGTDASLRQVVIHVLAYDKNWKLNLNEVEGLTDAVTTHLVSIINNGIKKAIELV